MAPPEARSQVELLHQISNIVSSDVSLERMLQELIANGGRTYALRRLPGLPGGPRQNEMVLRASQLPHASEIGNIRMKMGEGITGWVAQHKSVVALPSQRLGGRAVQDLSGAAGRHLSRPFFRCR